MDFAMSVWLVILLVILNFVLISAASDENVKYVDSRIKYKKHKWAKEEELEVMKIWNKYYRGGGNDNNPIIKQKWERLYPGYQKRSYDSVVQRVNLLLRQGFVLQAAHNKEASILLNETERDRRNRVWRLRKRFSFGYFEGSQRSPQSGDQNDYHLIDTDSVGAHQHSTQDQLDVQSNREGKNKLDSSIEHESEYSTKFQKHSAQEAGQTSRDARKNDHREKRPISSDTHQISTDFNKASILGSTAHDYSWPVNHTGYHYGYPQHHTGINTSTPQFDPISDYYTHQAIHFPDSERSYNKLNYTMHEQNPYLLQNAANNQVYRSESSQHYHGASSSNHQQISHQLNQETIIPTSAPDSILDFLRDRPIYSPPHNYHPF